MPIAPGSSIFAHSRAPRPRSSLPPPSRPISSLPPTGTSQLRPVLSTYRVRSSPPNSTSLGEDDDIGGAGPSHHVTRQGTQPPALAPAVPAAVPGGSHPSGTSQRAAGASSQPVGSTSVRQAQLGKCMRNMTFYIELCLL